MFTSGIMAPEGPVAASEAKILFDATAIMLAVIVPVILGTVAFAWWFRENNIKARYRAEWTYSGHIELVVWSVPTLVVLFLAGITWLGTHELDPFKPIASDQKTLNVQAVSLDWKWLFIYPEEGVATVDHLVVPVGRPLHLSITSASVMNSLLIPQLGSQIYAMAGMVTELNLKTDHAGTFHGQSAQFSGKGFSDMVFDVQSLPPDQYNSWADAARAGGNTLDEPAYTHLADANTPRLVQTFGKVQPGLFNTIVAKSGGSMQQSTNLSPPTPTAMEMP
ncbi:COX aromatic rich motif-containing protein [Rhizobium sp. L80/93]|uniref:COX aromatic rich motif-containing protein n=1 Tax=unclassified Rhizobium TaxID=2613769 RepID=UPI001ADAC1D8|nr:COX aromatic rich motif-containing protein [Rhizobium sp. L245/93]MBO9186438.1 COX aromatic rich motif-containing protein [Rhizobium sp. E27B/91]